MPTENPYENLNRAKKALAIATVLQQYDFTAASVRSFGAEQRAMGVEIAGVHPASDQTWEQVAELLESLPGPMRPLVRRDDG